MLVFCKCRVQWIASSCKEYILQCLILDILLCKWQCPRPNPSHCEEFCKTLQVAYVLSHHHIYTHSRIRSGLLTFFSSLVIQESLINCAGERLRSEKDSHCESFSSFCLSALYPVVEFAKAETQAFLALSARLYKSLTAKLEPSPNIRTANIS